MKAPTKGSGVELEGYGLVTVKAGPSPEHPYVWCAVDIDMETGEQEYESIHIDEFKEKRIR